MRRFPGAVAGLVVVALTAAACGGSSGSSGSTSSPATTAAASSSGDAAAILKSIDTTGSTGPQKLKLELDVNIKGTPSNAQLALFTKQPIHLGLDGVVDSTAKTADVNVSVTLGKSPVDAEIREGTGKTWIQISHKWYALSAGTLSSTTGTSLPAGVSTNDLNASKILSSIGDPSKLIDNATVSSDTVDGIDTDKVSGDVNIAAVAKAAENVSQAAGTSTTAAPAQSSIDNSVAQLNKVVKQAHVDIWVGKSDHKVHRVAFTVDAAMDPATQKSSGIDSLTVSLDVTTVDTKAPDVSAPSSVGSAQELQAAVIGLLGQVMGGAAASG
jgi:hypothetical protein